MDKLRNRKGGNIMEKYLGLEFEDLAEREQYIKDNADSIENMGYSKPIPSDQIEKLKETLADASIKKLEQEEAKKAAVQMYNEEIKGYKLTIKDVADKLKSKSTYVKEPCYKLITSRQDRSATTTRRVCWFTSEQHAMTSCSLTFSSSILPRQEPTTSNRSLTFNK